MKKAIIYGGAFNPPTIAHTLILSACARQARKDGSEIWLLPSGTRRDKHINVSRETRLEYVAALIADAGAADTQVRVLTTELDRITPTETIETVTELREKYLDYHQTWVFGADSVATMRQWHGGDWLVENLSMIVIPRIGTDESALTLKANGRVLRVATPPVSSTQVRTYLSDGRSVAGLVGPRVLDLLRAVR